jgi:predicted GIY-YIG superfamily endonuclease
MHHYVYILLLSNRQLYTGCTSDLKRRIQEHQGGHVAFTSQRLLSGQIRSAISRHKT